MLRPGESRRQRFFREDVTRHRAQCIQSRHLPRQPCDWTQIRAQIKYTAYRDKSLAERKELGVGNSDEMNTLFRFWCACAAPVP